MIIVQRTIRDNIFKGQYRCYFYPLPDAEGQQKDNIRTTGRPILLFQVHKKGHLISQAAFSVLIEISMLL